MKLEEELRRIVREEAERCVARLLSRAHAGVYDSRTNFPPGVSSRKAAIRAIRRTPGSWFEDDGSARSRIWYVSASDFHTHRLGGSTPSEPRTNEVLTDDELAAAALGASRLRRVGGAR